MNTPCDAPPDSAPSPVPAGASDVTHDSHLTPEQLAEEWVDRCIDLLRPMDWPGRMDAMMQLHDQLRSDFIDFDVFCQVFPIFVGQTLVRLGAEPVTELDQAHIYANSADPAHREAAGTWLVANGQPAP
jgi:hypothetical protein